MRSVALSTEDNPYNPLVDFDKWYDWDEASGYHTCGYLSRIAKTANELSDADQSDAIEAAIDEIIEFNLTGNYIKVIEE